MTRYSINGKDSLFYYGDMYRMITNSNVSKAYIRGFAFAIVMELNENIIARSILNFTQDRVITFYEPMAHIPPIFGRTSFLYHNKKVSTEVYMDYNYTNSAMGDPVKMLSADPAERGNAKALLKTAIKKPRF